jgi:acyl carrier protein
MTEDCRALSLAMPQKQTNGQRPRVGRNGRKAAEEEMQKAEICIGDFDAEEEVGGREFLDRSLPGKRMISPDAETTPLATVSAVVKAIWQELLRVPDVQSSDDFFDLGGDSLTAIRMLQRIDREYGEELLPPDIIYTASRLGDFTVAVSDAIARRRYETRGP